MVKVIDMQLIRYINIFSKITKIEAKHCFKYNNQIIFLVNKSVVSKAIGKDADNVKKMNRIIGRKIKIISLPSKEEKEIISFTEKLLSPIELNKIELKKDILFIDASRINKATLIGRNRLKEKELSKIIKDIFGFELKIG
ncbi:MAG: hypothetical protein WC260_00980 [Candidatus Pacearchaeota archaeon]